MLAVRSRKMPESTPFHVSTRPPEKSALSEADIVLVVLDSTRDLSREDDNLLRACAGRRALAVANKTELGVRAKAVTLRDTTAIKSHPSRYLRISVTRP